MYMRLLHNRQWKGPAWKLGQWATPRGLFIGTFLLTVEQHSVLLVERCHVPSFLNWLVRGAYTVVARTVVRLVSFSGFCTVPDDNASKPMMWSSKILIRWLSPPRGSPSDKIELELVLPTAMGAKFSTYVFLLRPSVNLTVSFHVLIPSFPHY